jgi:hypothetical protein
VFFPPVSPAFAFATSPAPRRRVRPDRFADRLLFFRPGVRFRRWEEEPNEPAPPAEEKPLTPTERALYMGFAIWVGFTFLALFVLVIFLHTPGNAN